MIGMPSATAFLFWSQCNPSSTKCKTDLIRAINSSSAAFSCNIDSNATALCSAKFARHFRTPADEFFRKNKKIPLPSIMHESLEHLSAAATAEGQKERTSNDIKIFVIGDVHGCYDELLDLHEKAVKENDYKPFDYVILVGDLCNKGPHSAEVIRHVRLSPGWFSVRGNHDDGALAAALGDSNRLKKETYKWVKDASFDGNDTDEDLNVKLCDDDVQWLSELPYTIRILGDTLGDTEDTIIVHAGLIPYCDIQDQKIPTMSTIRDVSPRCDENGEFTHFEYHGSKSGEAKSISTNDDTKKYCNEAVTWASAWNAQRYPPFRIIFGHDAKRKLQLYEGNWVTGLDTGAVYGGELTGIILPERKLVSVKSKEYSPIIKKRHKG